MRLNKFISHNSKYSRREADLLIKDGYVSLNRKVLNDLSYQVKKYDFISVKGRLVQAEEKVTMLVYNKPRGVLVTKTDDRERATIYHKLSGKYNHFMPVGRLDYASEGLLLLTDSVNVGNILMTSALNRTYNIKIDKEFTKEMENAMNDGLTLSDARAGGHEKSKIIKMTFAPFIKYEIRGVNVNFTKLRVTINEGKNRELRRFFAHFGANMLDLKRVAFGDIELNNLPTNKTRYYTRSEYSNLYAFLKEGSKERRVENLIKNM